MNGEGCLPVMFVAQTLKIRFYAAADLPAIAGTRAPARMFRIHNHRIAATTGCLNGGMQPGIACPDNKDIRPFRQSLLSPGWRGCPVPPPGLFLIIACEHGLFLFLNATISDLMVTNQPLIPEGTQNGNFT